MSSQLFLSMAATAENFIETFGQLESIELSNIDNASENSIYRERILNALALSFDEIMGYDSLCSFSGKVAIRRALKPLMLDIARYKLDTIDRRQDIIDAYEKAIKFMESCRELKSKLLNNLTNEELELLDLVGQNSASSPRIRNGRRIGISEQSLSSYRNQKLLF